MKTEPLTSVHLEITLLFRQTECWWEIRQSINGKLAKVVAMDATPAPTGPGSEYPWIDQVVDTIVSRAWQTAYTEQLQLPFP